MFPLCFSLYKNIPLRFSILPMYVCVCSRYQYYDGTPLWPFGWGLSYTTFALRWHSSAELTTTRTALEYGLTHVPASAPLESLDEPSEAALPTVFSVTATNTGHVTSDVTVLAFLTAAETGMLGAGGRAGAARTGAEEARRGAQPQRELFAFCRLKDVAPRQSAQCDLAVASSVVAHNATIYSGVYDVVVELGNGDGVRGRLLVVDDSRT